MANVSYHGTGTDEPLADQVGQGQGLQVGLTEIDFGSGDVKLLDSSGHPTSIGRFVGLHGSDSEGGDVKSVIFKSKVSCTILIDKMIFPYENINQWIAFNHLNTSRMQIVRTATGQNPDVFDFDFQASDDPEYRLTIQNSNEDALSEVVFPTLSRGVNTYTQVINLRGAKKIIVGLVTGAGAGNVSISAEYFDVGSGGWIELIPATELFNAIATGQTLKEQIGDTIQRPINIDTVLATLFSLNSASAANLQTFRAQTAEVLTGQTAELLTSRIGTVLPTGDNKFRFKAIVAGAALSFSLGVEKVFN